MKTAVFHSGRDAKLRKGLMAYSIVLLGGLFVAVASLLFAGSADAAIVDRGITCSGAGGSGASCNVLGHPQNVNHMFGCYNFGSGFKCYEVPVEYVKPGLPGCYMDTSGNWHASCGCNVSACEDACRAAHAGQPGTYTHPGTCSGCGQNFTCGCTITPTVTPPVSTPPQGCPSTQARFLVGDSGLVQSGSFNIDEVPPFQYSVLINGDVNQKFQGNVRLTGPFGSREHNNGNTRDVPTPYQAGTYRLEARFNGELCDSAQVQLRNIQITNLQCWETGCNDAGKQCAPGSGLVCQNNRCVNPDYPNNSDCKPDVELECWETGCSIQGNSCADGLECQNDRCVNPQYPNSETCEAVPGITLEKVAVNGSGPYNIGQTIPFRIVITNTGQTTYTAINFVDTYNTARLDLIRIVNLNNNQDVTGNFTVNRTLGRITANDLTSFMGDLGPGQTFRLRFDFRALTATSQTCNDVSIQPNGGDWMDDEACVSVNQPPPTDL
ncbi:MAG: hypothetical protein TR69_WS6001001223 [candidate division WS6 bacterium OLB20]|uniref:DUF11 domain-containing protein n=1 Tax=candidate division WS6 bacterium OLB20 TaxID=1617426 RepID=A0A136LX48_9BACT|nr:MAG: hypothetical protein TR69_WS6001001223 [candidate division WS6 bacterium OLB20]